MFRIIRAFLVHFHNQVLQAHNGVRQSRSHPGFDFTGGSIGNFFFAGARTFFGSLPAAIFLFSKVAGIPSGSRVLPAVISEDRILLGAELRDGTRIRGQYCISHPQPKQQQRRHKQVVKKGPGDTMSSLHSSPISKITYLLHDPAWRKLSRNQSTNIVQQQWNDRNVISPEPNPLVLDAISNANVRRCICCYLSILMYINFILIAPVTVYCIWLRKPIHISATKSNTRRCWLCYILSTGSKGIALKRLA